MGFNQSDLTPQQITPITPPGKNHVIKLAQIDRTDTSSAVVAMFPAGMTPYRVYLSGDTNSDAETSATVTITIADNSGTVSTGSVDVTTDGASTTIVNMTNLPLVGSVPSNGDYKVSAVYAESGTASTEGGPWKISLEFIQ